MDRRDFLVSVAAAAGAASLAGCGNATATAAAGRTARDLARSRPSAARSRTSRRPARPKGSGGHRRRRHRRAVRRLEAGQIGLRRFPAGRTRERGGRQFARRAKCRLRLSLGRPLPAVADPRGAAVRELLAELGVLQGDPHAVQPGYDERYLCATPQERLYRNGWWQEGLLPQTGVSAGERQQYQRFADLMEGFRRQRDQPGGGPSRCRWRSPAAISSCWRSTGSACATGCWRKDLIHRTALVRQLRLPRRLRHGLRQGLGLGGHPLLCLPRRRGAERQQRHRAHRAGRQRLAG